MSPWIESHNAWYRSLYWRAAVSFVLLVAGLVAAQAGMSYWVLSRDIAEQASRRDLTLKAATGLGAALATHPSLDLAEYLRSVDPTEHLFVIMRDGRVAGERAPLGIVNGVVSELRDPGRTAMPSSWRTSGYSAAAVIVDGGLGGAVGYVRPATFDDKGIGTYVLGFCVLVGGALITALLAFGPTRRRLRDLENAARRLEAGDLSARARESGHDEVSELARAFNSMAAALAKHERDREESDSARRQLVADVSHELMTPLTAIRGYLETFAMAGINLDTFTRQKQVATARRETQRLERLIGDLLDTARFEAGGGHIEPVSMNVRELFERVAEHHEHESTQRDIRLQQTILPLAETVIADPFRLEQALVNVTANAFRHTPDRGVVELRADSEGDMIVLSVTDSGPGIAQEHVPLIFNRFYKVPADRNHFAAGGSGLGLSIVKAIVERHGGLYEP